MSNLHHFKDSESMAHCDYDDVLKVLKIKFHSSPKEHEYANCSREIYEGLKAAKSPGSYFHQNIRKQFQAR
jgi:hypothetical protein